MKEIQVIDWGTLDYGEAFVRQQQIVGERIKAHRPDCLLLVEHPPVVTIGRSGSLNDLHISKKILDKKGIALHKVDRGGRATFHGPGQLVVYPIVKMVDRDLHAFMQRLLDTVADVLNNYGLVPEYQKGRPGVWVNGAKIASIGLAVRKWVTYHGVALNVSIDPEWFDLIVPCGRRDEKITCMNRELGTPVAVEAVKKHFVDHFFARNSYNAIVEINIGIGKHSPWLVKSASDLKAVNRMQKRLVDLQLATVCQSARCPNLSECFAMGSATFMILGTRCTRACRFCAVDKGPPGSPDAEEPQRIAMAVRQMGIRHAVVTSVTRDDLPDGGAGQFAETVGQIRKRCPGVSVEVLVPDFAGNIAALETVCAACPDVFNHNIETVVRLYAPVRPMADYQRSLGVLSHAATRGLMTKSGLMLGLGEKEAEITKVFVDLKKAGCRLLTLGQYLAPSKAHAPVVRYVTPDEFESRAEDARRMGFTAVIAGPLVRSSYRAHELLEAESVCHNCKTERFHSWKAKDLSSRSAPVPICTGKMSPRPHAGL